MQARKIALEAGAGVFTAAALAAGAAYLLSDKKRQVRAKAWVAKTRREVAANIKRARRMSETEYTRIVNAAVKRYGGLSDANKMELARVAMDLKGEWQRLQKIARAKTGTRSTAKKASGSRAAKKTRASRRAR
jgi:hypothetical protein